MSIMQANSGLSRATADARYLKLDTTNAPLTGSLPISANGGKTTLALTSTGTNTGMTLGGDTTLYRSAADVLTTDDSMSVLTNMGIGAAPSTQRLRVVESALSTGESVSVSTTQTTPQSTDQSNSALRLTYTITANSATNQLVSRVFQLTANNNLTGGGAVTNMRVLNIALSTQTGTTTTSLPGIYIESGTASGTVTNAYGLQVGSLQGTSQAGLAVTNLTTGTNNTQLLLGTSTIPSGNFAAYSSSSNNSYFAGAVGLGTVAPTHSLTFSSTSTGATWHNVADQTTNYERTRQYYTGNVFNIVTEAGGSGTARPITISGNNSQLSLGLNVGPSTNSALVARRDSTGVGNIFQVYSSGLQGSSGNQSALVADPIVNQSGTAGYAMFRANPSETATGSGTKRLLWLQVGSTDKFVVDNTGTTTMTDSANFVFGTSTGTKIGTATTQKIGYWNATPVVQPAAIADATGSVASVMTQLNLLLAALRSTGQIAT